jgi:hypothetical protein
MECPSCGSELQWDDVFGRNLHIDALGRIRPGFIKTGDIYRCPNEECESHWWYTLDDDDNNLYDGYPC